MKTIFKQSLKTILVIAGLFGIVALVSAWTAPSSAPPGGNVAAPINVSTSQQNLQGSKIIGYTDPTNVLALVPGLNVTGVFQASSRVLFNSSTKGVVIGNPSGYDQGKGALNAEKVCLQGNCQSSWPSGGSLSYSNVYTPSHVRVCVPSGCLGDKSLGEWESLRDVTIGSTDTYFFCALTNWYFREEERIKNLGNCYLRAESGQWKLKAQVSGERSELICGAVCLKK